MGKKPLPNGRGSNADCHTSVKLTQAGMRQLVRLQELMQGSQVGNAVVSRGEVIRRAIRQQLLAELGLRADPSRKDDPYTQEYLLLLCEWEIMPSDVTKLELAMLRRARLNLRKLHGKDGKDNR